VGQISIDLICSNCFTQSQQYDPHNDEEDIMKLAAKARHGGYIRTEYEIKKRKRSRRLVQHGEKLPNLEACLEAFQAVLKATAKAAVKLAGISDEDAIVDMCGKLWIGYLRSWVKSANHYGKLYPEVSFCMRDMFLPSNVKYLLRFHSSRMMKEEDNDNENDNDDPDVVNGAGRDSTLSTKMEDHDHDESSSLADKLPRDLDESNTRKKNKRSSTKMEDNPTLVVLEENVDNDDGSDDESRMALNQNSQGTCNTDVPDESNVSRAAVKSKHLLNNKHSRYYLIAKINSVKKKDEAMSSEEAAARLAPSLHFVLACIHCALLHFRAGIAASHICQWCADGRLPYHNISPLLPDDLKSKVNGILVSFFQTTTMPSVSEIEYASELIGIASGYVPIAFTGKCFFNAPLLAARYLKDMGLNQRVLNICYALMGIPHCSDRTTQEYPKALKGAAIGNLASSAHLIAVIVVACRLTRGWSTWICKRHSGLSGTSTNNDTSSSDKHETSLQCKRFIPWTSSQLQLIGNGEMVQDYLNFFDSFFAKSITVKQKDRFREWLGESYDDFLANLSHSKGSELRPMSIPSYVVDLSDQRKIDASSLRSSASLDGDEYVFYDRVSSHAYNCNPLPYHPQHGLLVEYMAHKCGAEPSDIHLLVHSLDAEIEDNIK